VFPPSASAARPSPASRRSRRTLSYLPFSGSVLGQLSGELEGYTMTKSALHFPADRPLPKPLVRKLIEVRLAEIAEPSS
jgi:hypothetical protein